MAWMKIIGIFNVFLKIIKFQSRKSNFNHRLSNVTKVRLNLLEKIDDNIKVHLNEVFE